MEASEIILGGSATCRELIAVTISFGSLSDSNIILPPLFSSLNKSLPFRRQPPPEIPITVGLPRSDSVKSQQMKMKIQTLLLIISDANNDG